MTQAQTFIITGAGRNMGSELAKKAFEMGFSVALISRTKTDLEKVKDELLSKKKEIAGQAQAITIHVADLTSEMQVKKAFNEIAEAHPHIRGLVNNAGTWFNRARVEELTKKSVMEALDLNFFTAFMSTSEVLSLHRSRGSVSDLSISFLGATASLQGRKNVAAFCLGKGANRILAQSLAREVAPDGIHVSHVILDGLFDNARTKTISPGLTEDQFMKQSKVAEVILNLMLQDRSCWTFELDLRPFKENW